MHCLPFQRLLPADARNQYSSYLSQATEKPGKQGPMRGLGMGWRRDKLWPSCDFSTVSVLISHLSTGSPWMTQRPNMSQQRPWVTGEISTGMKVVGFAGDDPIYYLHTT